MPVAPSKACLQITLKQGLRRCVYRRWEATVKGKVLITKRTELERMYRGNTPYPIANSRPTQKCFPTPKAALAALRRRTAARRKIGFSPFANGRQNGRAH